MWWINRLYLDGVGHEESFYKDITLNFYTAPDAGTASQPLNHSYLQLVNGGGKTTLLSFFLTMFEPRKTQFVQVISSRLQGKKYHYNDYFHPELSTLLLELVNQQGQRVLLGQYHQKINDETEVIYFLCDEGESLFDLPFERVPSRSRAEQQPDMKPFVGNIKLAREWLKQQEGRQDGFGHHWRVANTQTDWQASLKELAVNIDMIKTMVTLNSEEGGIRRFASYQSERDFLSSFFGCVMSRDNLDSLIESCRQEVKRGNEINQQRRDEAFYQQLLATWNRFEPPATQHLHTRQAMAQIEDEFKEALRDLRHHAKLLNESHEHSKEQVTAKKSEVEEFYRGLGASKQLRAELNYQTATMKYQQSCRTLKQHDHELEELNKIIQALSTVGSYQGWVSAKHDTEQLDLQVRLHREQHEQPLQVAFDHQAAQSLLIHRKAIERLSQEMAEVVDELKEMDTQGRKHQQDLNKTAESIGRSQLYQKNLAVQQKNGLVALETLKGKGLIAPTESPENAPLRWQREVDATVVQQQRAKRHCTDMGSELKASELRWQEAKEKSHRSREQQAQAVRERDTAKSEHHRLTEQWLKMPPKIHEVMSNEPLDWNAARVESQLADCLSSMQVKVQALQQHCSTRKSAYDELQAAGHQLSSSTVNLALTQLREAGIAGDKMWAFPQYLAQVFQDDPEEIANKVDADPGRYMGIVVLDNATLTEVKAVQAKLDWQERPVPIYLINDADLSDTVTASVPDCVIAAASKLLYSEQATQAKLAELQTEIESLTQDITSRQQACNTLQAFQANLSFYFRSYGNNWIALHHSVHEAEQTLAQSIADQDNAKQALSYQQAAYNKACEDEAQADQLLSMVQEKLNTVNVFLEREWHDYRLAEQKLPNVKQELTAYKQQQQQLIEKSQQLDQKKQQLSTKHNRLADNHDRWRARIAGPLYSQVSSPPALEFTLAPDEAHHQTEKAAFALEQARSNHDIQELIHRLEQAQSNQTRCYQALNKMPAWHEQQATVVRLADSAPDTLARQHREQTANIEHIQTKRHHAAVQVEHLKSQLSSATTQRPANPPKLEEAVGHSLETLEQEMRTVTQGARSMQQELKIAQDSLQHLEQQVNEWANKNTLCKTCIGRIEGIDSIAANGLPSPVEDLESFDEHLHTLKLDYDKARSTSDIAKRAAENQWQKVAELTRQEWARDEEVRAATLFLRHWQGQTFETALMNLEGLSQTIDDFHAATLDLIERIYQSMEVAVRDLEGHLERALQVLRQAKKVRIPESSTVLPGRAVLRIDNCIDRIDIDLNTKAKECLERWMREGKIPSEKGQRDLLTTDLVQSVFPEGHLEIRLLKTTTGSNKLKYTAINALEGSGGQLLTTAFLLFLTVAKVREMDTNIRCDGFLLADNPIGECNADSLLRIQMAMADACNIQLIYLSGHTDPNAKSMFQNHLLLNKVGKLKNKELVGYLDDKHRLWSANLLSQPKRTGAELQ